jgi:hypothetical protein
MPSHRNPGQTDDQRIQTGPAIHISGYVLAGVLIALTLTVAGWLTAGQHYSQREAELIQKIDQNRQVLSDFDLRLSARHWKDLTRRLYRLRRLSHQQNRNG